MKMEQEVQSSYNTIAISYKILRDVPKLFQRTLYILKLFAYLNTFLIRELSRKFKYIRRGILGHFNV